eukprot:COSAG01_NODE_10666_length_2108_cov_4.768044_2_plen_435_part_00
MSIPVEVTTLRKNLENFRSTLYSAAQHLKTLNLSDADRKSLTKKYNDAYVEFGELSGTLMSDELDKAKTHQPSRRQQSKWVPWTDITRLTKSVLEYLEGILASLPTTMGVMENKKMQQALQLVLYVLILPLRNNYTNLRLITPDQETLDILKQSNSPNYVVVDQGGFVTLVINKFKTDARSAEVDYDPTTDFRINHTKTQRFELSRPQSILTKYGFELRCLADTLLEYHNLQVTLLGDCNPHRLFFFEELVRLPGDDEAGGASGLGPWCISVIWWKMTADVRVNIAVKPRTDHLAPKYVAARAAATDARRPRKSARKAPTKILLNKLTAAAAHKHLLIGSKAYPRRHGRRALPYPRRPDNLLSMMSSMFQQTLFFEMEAGIKGKRRSPGLDLWIDKGGNAQISWMNDSEGVQRRSSRCGMRRWRSSGVYVSRRS